ncbi:GerW family sporulation protein [Brassicibacter mesophilus]|jgi:sporulation protein YtfJ|uniref:GerW family sporulation protein n=1 Tax=Brassicibacter mesophilus TaxID=745119 RepID=UPI003D244E0B
MSEHPIEGLMKTTMDSIKEMVDVNTIVGDPVESPDGQVIIPISRVSFGFAAGGAEYGTGNKEKKGDENNKTNGGEKIPFGGGSGAGVSVQPVAFIVVGNGNMKLLPVDHSTNVLSNLLEFIPKITNSIQHRTKDKEKKERKYDKEDN